MSTSASVSLPTLLYRENVPGQSSSFSIDPKKICLLFIFYLLPLFDNLNGYLIFSGKITANGLLSPSQIGRLVVFLLCMPLVTKKKVFFHIFILITFFMLFIELFWYCFHLNHYGFAYGIVNYNKITYFYLLIILFYSLIDEQCISSSQLIRHFIFSAFIYALLLHLATLTGLGFSTYESGTFGKRGFISSANGLGIYLGSASLATIHHFRQNKQLRFFIIFAVIITGTIMVGNKGGLISSGVVMLYILKSARLRIKVLILALTSLTIYYFHQPLTELFLTIFDVISFRYKNADSFFRFFFSSRDSFIAEAFRSFDISGWHIIRIITGTGSYISFRNFTISGIFRTLENDLFDLFFMYGALFALTYFFAVLFAIFRGISRKKYLFAVTCLLISAYSLLSGHTLFNGMSSVVLSLFMTLSAVRPTISTSTPN